MASFAPSPSVAFVAGFDAPIYADLRCRSCTVAGFFWCFPCYGTLAERLIAQVAMLGMGVAQVSAARQSSGEQNNQKLVFLWIELTLRWASATSGRLGKNVMKSRYSDSACLNACSEYNESAIESFARGT